MSDPLDLSAIPTLKHGRTFEENIVGDVFRTAGRTITESDLISFVTLAGLNEPLFLDDSGSSEVGYRGRLVPGTLTLAYAEGLVLQTGVNYNTGTAFLGMSFDILGPVFVGDTITVVVEVVETRPTRRGDRGIVTTRNTVVKGDGAVVIVYNPKRMILGNAAAP